MLPPRVCCVARAVLTRGLWPTGRRSCRCLSPTTTNQRGSSYARLYISLGEVENRRARNEAMQERERKRDRWIDRSIVLNAIAYTASSVQSLSSLGIHSVYRARLVPIYLSLFSLSRLFRTLPINHLPSMTEKSIFKFSSIN